MLAIPHGSRVDFGLPNTPADDPYFAVTVYPSMNQGEPVTTYHRLPEGVESPFDWLSGLNKEYTDFNEKLREQRRASRRAMWSRNDGKVKWCVAGAVLAILLLVATTAPVFSIGSSGLNMLLVTLVTFAILCGSQVYTLFRDASKFDYRDHPLAIVPRENGVRVYDSPVVPKYNKKKFPEFVIPGEDITRKVIAAEVAHSL